MSLMKPLRGLLVLLVMLPCTATPTIGEESEQVKSQAEALLALSERQNLENHALALQTAQQALELWQASADKTGMARTYAQIGRYHVAQSNLPEASENCGRALELWRDLNRPREQAGMLIMLGFIDARKEEWSNSISLLTQAQALVDEENDPGLMGRVAAGLADIFNESGMPEIGLVHYRRALDYYRRTPEARDDMRIILYLGVTHYLLGNNTEALTHLNRALISVDPDGLDAASCYHQLGRVDISIREYDAALTHLQSALTIYTRASNPAEAAQVRALMGQVYQQQGQLESARQKYLQALAAFDKISDRVNQAVVYYALGSLELLDRRYDVAEGYLRQSIELTEDMLQTNTSSDLTASFSATVHERYEKYIECLMRQRRARPAEGFTARAFESSELGRARSLVEVLRATGTDLVPGLDPTLAEQEKSLRQALRVKKDYKVALLSRDYKKESLDALEAELARLGAEYKRVTETIRTRYPSCEQITRPAAWGLSQIQKEVIADGETVLLEYSLGEDESYVWAVTRDEIKSYELPARATVEEAAQNVYKLLTTPPGTEVSDKLPSALRELSQMVLVPVATELKKRRVIVVADGALNYIPFQVLQSPTAEGEPLVTNCEVSNAPSATILGELRRDVARRPPAPKVLAAFGNPEFAPSRALLADVGANKQSAELEEGRLMSALRDTELNGDSFDPSVLKPLFYARVELANLRNVADKEETFFAAGRAATRERLFSADLTQYAIVHFATHGLFDNRRPENSGLVLSTIGSDGRAVNGFVGLRDVYSLRAPVDLVVLSACQTALGKDMRGEGLVGLTRGFMYAGASGVVASLWKVEDKATAELMKQFYANMLRKGMPPGAALREAQNSVRQNPRWRSPYYWAAFTLQGEYSHAIRHRPSPPVSHLKMIAAGAGLVTLLAAAAWWYRRRRSRVPGGV